MQLNILQGIEQPLKQRIIQLKMSVVYISHTTNSLETFLGFPFHFIPEEFYTLKYIAFKVRHNLTLVLLFRTSPTLAFNTHSVPAKPGDSAQPSPNTARAPLLTTLFHILTLPVLECLSVSFILPIGTLFLS